MPGKLPSSGHLSEQFSSSIETASPEPVEKPTPSESFANESQDRLKGNPSTPLLILTPEGAPTVQGSNRRSVAEKDIDASKLPDTTPPAKQSRKKQFNRDIRAERNEQHKGRNNRCNNNDNGPSK